MDFYKAQIENFNPSELEFLFKLPDVEHAQSDEWYGFDFDGTLATYYGWDHPSNGAPIWPMIDKVRTLLAGGSVVKIVTARVSSKTSWKKRAEHTAMIKEFCFMYFGRELEVTAEKDNNMVLLYDDRAVAVERNTGYILAEPSYGASSESTPTIN